MPGSPLTSLDAVLGASSGALEPSNWRPAEGTRVLVLGSDAAGVRQKVTVGDYLEAEQVADIAAGKLIRFRAHVRPGSTPAGVSWTFVARLNGADRVSRTVARDLELTDLALPVAHVLGSVSFGFRLLLSGAAGSHEVELPGVYVDALLVEASSPSPVVVNRSPEPGEAGVPITSAIRLEVANVEDTTALSPVLIYVGGALAYSSALGGQQPGFSVSATNVGGAYDVSYVVTPAVPFDGETVVPVRVVASYGLTTVDTTYSFTTADVNPPKLLAATAVGRRTVRAAFSENVLQASASGSSDALNPANWTVTYLQQLLEYPAVPLAVVEVVPHDSLTVDLTTSVEMTAGANYLLEVAAVQDLAGNAVVPPYDVAGFVGYTCAFPSGREFDLIGFLPKMNVAEDATRDLYRFMACLQEPTNLILCDIDEWTDILDPDIAPERFVDVMLAEAGNPFDFNLSLVDKRRLMRVLVPIYKTKGTDAGIINAIRFFLGIEVTITVPAFVGVWDIGLSELDVDTVLGTSDPVSRYTFVINSPVTLTDEERKRVVGLAKYMKAAHTHFLVAEPEAPPALPDHWEVGLSELGTESQLH